MQRAALLLCPQVNLDAVNVAATIYVQGRNLPHPALLPANARHDPREQRRFISENAKKVRLLFSHFVS